MAPAVTAGWLNPSYAFCDSIDDTLFGNGLFANLFEHTDSEATICGDNDAHFSSPVEQHDGLPSINSMTPLSEVRPQHVRRHSSLRHEYHPLSPSAEDTAHERKLNESINGIGSWTSPTANFVSGNVLTIDGHKNFIFG